MERRHELLEATAAYLLRNGVAGLSLRPLAAAIDTKARLLIYHFGSKEQLLIEAMQLIRSRAQMRLQAMIRDELRGADAGTMLRAFWKWTTSRQNRPFLRLFFEVHGLALQYPKQYSGYLRGAVRGWVEMLGSDVKATLIVGAIDGLLLDLLSTGDLKRTTKAINELARRLKK